MEVHKIAKIPKNVWIDFYHLLEENILEMDHEKLKQWKYDYFLSRGCKSSINIRKTLLRFFRYLITQGKIQSKEGIFEFNRKLDPSIRLSEKDVKNISRSKDLTRSRSKDQIQTKEEISTGQKDISNIIQEKDRQIKKLKERTEKTERELDKSKRENIKLKKEYETDSEVIAEKENEIKNLRRRLKKLQEIVNELEEEKSEIALHAPREQSFENEKNIRPTMSDYTYIPWWEKIGLFSDPFPSNQGLNKIDKEFYDDIVLRTEIFNRYLYLAKNRSREILNNIIVVYGEYGSGKTTFFQYLERPLLNAGILPIYLMISSDPSTEQIKKEFHGQFLKEVIESNSTSGKAGYLYPRLEAQASIEIIQNQLDDILVTTDYKGFIVFIDGLHKEAEHSESVLGFIKLLQNDFEYFSSFKKIPISFVIAGCLDWKTHLKKYPYLTGSKTGEENIPDLSYTEAFDLINMRFRTFSENKNEPFQLKEEVISKIWSNLKTNLKRGIVPRDMIDHVKDLIKDKSEGKRVTEKLNISLSDVPLKITPDILRRIRIKIANNPQIKRIIYSDIIKYFGNDKNGFRRCLEDFIEIYHAKKIKISKSGKIDYTVIRDLGIDIENIRVLEEFDFLERKDRSLQKKSTVSKSGTQKLAKEIYTQKLLKVDKRLEKFIENIEEEMDLQVEDYLQEIYKTKERTIRSISKKIRENPDKSVIVLSELRRKEKNGRIRILIDKAISEHEKIREHHASMKGIIPKEHLIERTSSPICILLRVVLFMEENVDLSDLDDDEVKELWDKNWIFCDDYFNFKSQIAMIKRKRIQINEKEDNRIVLSYKRAFESLVNLIDDLKNCDKILRINYTALTNEDKKKLHSIRLYYFNDEYFDSAKKLIVYFEPRIQIFIQNCLEMKYGDRWRRRLPSDVNERIENGQEREREKSRTLFQKPEYLLCYCDFDNYKKIMLEKTNWSGIFEFLAKEWNHHTFESLCNDFRRLRNKTQHNYIQWLDKNHHEIKKGMEFVRDLFESFRRLNYRFLSKENIFYRKGEEGSGEGYILFSLRGNRDQTCPYRLVVKFSELNRFVQHLKGKKEVEIQLELKREEGYEYGLEFRKYVSFLAFLIFHDYIKVKGFKNGKVILDLTAIGTLKETRN